MKLTVIVPMYNAKDAIKECMEALAAQERKADNIILIDNNSTDGTYEYAKNLIEVNRWDVMLLREDKKGASAARNKGIKTSKDSTDIVAFTDSDCVARRDWLKNIEEFFINNQTAGGLGGVTVGCRPEGLMRKFMAVQRYYLEAKRLSGWVFDKNGILRGTLIDSNNGAFRNDLLQEIGGFDEEVRVAEDADLSIKIIKKGYPIYVTADNIVVYHKDVSDFWEYFRKFFKYRTGEVLTIKNHFKHNIIIKMPYFAPVVLKNSKITALIDIKLIMALIALVISVKFYWILIVVFLTYFSKMNFALGRIILQNQKNTPIMCCMVFSILFIATRALGPIGRIRGAFRYGIIAM